MPPKNDPTPVWGPKDRRRGKGGGLMAGGSRGGGGTAGGRRRGPCHCATSGRGVNAGRRTHRMKAGAGDRSRRAVHEGRRRCYRPTPRGTDGMTATAIAIRIVLAKVGLDGHDRGVKV